MWIRATVSCIGSLTRKTIVFIVKNDIYIVEIIIDDSDIRSIISVEITNANRVWIKIRAIEKCLCFDLRNFHFHLREEQLYIVSAIIGYSDIKFVIIV